MRNKEKERKQQGNYLSGQLQYRDSGHERFALVLETNATQGAAAQFFLQLQYTENPRNICASLTWLQVS